MDLTTFLTAFTTLFVAEFGDKTQLAVVCLTASSKKPWAVLAGAALALSVVSAIGVLFGQTAMRLIPEAVVHRIAATTFIAIGVWMWARP